MRLAVGLGAPPAARDRFAEGVHELCDEVYPEAERIRLVCDDLNTHSAASFYEAFAPWEARQLAERVEFVCTPVHGSWLNVVEVAFWVLAWVALRNAEGATVEWRFAAEEAPPHSASPTPRRRR